MPEDDLSTGCNMWHKCEGNLIDYMNLYSVTLNKCGLFNSKQNGMGLHKVCSDL